MLLDLLYIFSASVVIFQRQFSLLWQVNFLLMSMILILQRYLMEDTLSVMILTAGFVGTSVRILGHLLRGNSDG